MPASEQLGNPPEYILRKLANQQEVRDLIAGLTPQPDPGPDVPDGYFAWGETEYTDGQPAIRHTASDSEFAEHLASLGIHRTRYRAEPKD